jgi:hypothetical protein
MAYKILLLVKLMYSKITKFLAVLQKTIVYTFSYFVVRPFFLFKTFGIP